ncbi:type III secretion system effector EspX1 [Escherichia coli]|uniref:type III secretion system effector EspX1 n=1 Tax=Escherichia coli TaxID=562 RepID=UPI001482DFFC|nr:type III secretion system effector EspX1 [Escherichia coli]MCV5851054.1 type III secretion system effector EspX1 [Escherichia coli]MDQ9278466.1 type III secretion system effector EspX1 [Escherichia coli]NNT55144.1 type III secretion system effector EspX1 [Escherichia coli]NNT81324.1 type III secretion system effector EspX1 [Escherichia coli]HAI4303323.1 type III secretion system effector EspX1 [Escherichia coli]
MTDGISTSPHCLYKSNIVDDVIINKTRQNELVKVFCEYKTEFLILFDDFFRSQDLPKPSPVLHHFFQYTHLRDAHFYRCKLIEHTVQFSFFKHKGITLLRLDVFDDITSECLSEEIKIYQACYEKFIKFLKANFNQEIYPELYTPEIFYEACRNLQSFYDHQETSQKAKYSAIVKKKSYFNKEIRNLIKKNIYPELYNEQCNKIPASSTDDNQKITWQHFKTSNAAYSQLCEKLSLLKSSPSRLIEKSAYCSNENMITNKFDVVFSYCGDNIKEFILLLPCNKSLEMYELNEQKIQYLTTPNININKLLLSNVTIKKSNLSHGYYFGCVLSNISCFESDLSNTIFSNGEINNLFIKKSNIFGTSFTNTMIKNLRCEDIMPGRWTTQLVNKHLGYRYTGVFKTLASIDDKPSRFEILIPLVQTLVRDNVKLNNDVYKELKKFMHDYDKTSPEMRKYLQSINESMFLMKKISHQD